MLKIVMEDMKPGEVAAMYQEGDDSLILVSRDLTDDVRASAVNELLMRIKTAPDPALRLRRLHIA